MIDTPPRSADPLRRRRHRKRRQNSLAAAAARVWRGWWVEIVVGILVAFGIFLLVEQMNIRQTLLAGALRVGNGLADFLSTAVRATVGRLRATTLSDAVAYVLFGLVVGLVAWRTRERLMTMPRFTEVSCPRCGSELHRIHRRWLDRLLDWYVPVRRYKCANHGCEWRGLRVRRHRHL